MRARRHRHGVRLWWRNRFARRRRRPNIETPSEAKTRLETNTDIKGWTVKQTLRRNSLLSALLFKVLLPNNAGHYRGTQRACPGHGELYEELASADDRMHLNTAAPSAARLRGQTAAINHHLSADLQATHNSLRGPPAFSVLNSCLIPSLLPSLPHSTPTSPFVSVSGPRCVFICSRPDGSL